MREVGPVAIERNRFLVLAPMPVELRPVVKVMGLARSADGTHRGTVGDAEVVAVLAGIGPAAAEQVARTQIAAVDPTHVLVVGVAGGVRPDLAVGSLLVPAVVRETDDAAPAQLGPELKAHPLGDAALEGTLITTRDLITERSVHDAHQAAGVDAVDMETSAVALVCEELGRPWTAFRGISDHVDEGLLADSLGHLPDVDVVQHDAAWRSRLDRWLRFGVRLSWVLAALLGLGALLVVGNTVRLDIQSRREEIAVLQQLGATDGFIRWPFLYLGACYGLVAGVLALALLTAADHALRVPLADLAQSYGSRFALHGFDLPWAVGIVVASGVLGWLGAGFVAGHYLRQTRPTN